MTAPSQATNAQQQAPGAVLGTAKEQTGHVVGETLEQAKNLTAELQGSARAQLDKQSETVAVQLRALSQQLRDGDASGLAGKLMAEAGERLQSLSQYVDRAGPQGLIDDVRRYARRNPGQFFVTAALAGLVSGRLAKAVKAGPTRPTGELPGRHATPAPAPIPVTGSDLTGSDLTGSDLTGAPVILPRTDDGDLR